MARQVLPIVGAVVGTFFGSPQLGFAIGSIIGNVVDPQRIRAPGLKELPVLGVTEGAYRQVAYGTTVIRDCQLIDWGDLDPVIVEEQQGKGGGPVVESTRLYQTFAVAIGEPCQALRYLKINGQMKYDVRPGSTILAESAEFAERFRFYDGSETQLPDPDLEALPRNGVGNTPAYRGTSLLVFPRYDLTDNSGRIPTIEAEVSNNAIVAQFTGLITDDDFYLGAPGSLALGQSNVFGGLSPVGNSISSAPNGTYVAFGDASSPYVRIFKQDTTTGVYSQLTTGIGAIGAQASRTAWHPSGNYLALMLSSSSQVVLMARSGDTFTVIETISVPNPVAIAWSPDGQKLAVCESDFSTTVRLYPFVSGVFGSYSAATSTINLFGAQAIRFSRDSLHLATGGNQALEVFDCSSATIAHMDAVSADPSCNAGVGFSANGGYIYTLGTPSSGSNRLAVFSFNAAAIPSTDALEFDNYPSSQPSDGTQLDVTADGEFLAVAEADTTPKVYEANGTGDLLTLVASQPPSGGGGVSTVAWTNDPGIGIVGGGSATLQSIVADICDRCAIPAGKLDLSALTDSVKGVTLGGAYDGAGAITTLMPAFLFDLYSADRQLRAVKRGSAVKGTLTVNDLLDEPDENTLRGQGIEYPRVLQLKYLNPGQDYAAPATTVTNKTTSARVRGEVQIDLPVAFDETEALNVATRMIKVMWEDVNGEAVFSLPSGPFAWLTPTDCLGLVLRGATYRIRVEKVEQTGGQLKVTARRDRQSAYTSNLTAIPLPPPQPPPPSLAGVTTFVPMNIPGRVDADDQLGFVFGMTGLPGTAWQGANIAYRIAGGTDWTSLGNFTTRAIMGELLSALPAASEFYTDTTNLLEVELIGDDQLESLTPSQFLSERNPAAIVYPDGTAELLQFRDAVDEGGRSWTLSTLQRGRLATVPGPHLAAARFVMLSGTQFVALPSALIGQALQFRVTSIGTSPETAPVYDFTWNPVHSQLEFPPAHVFAERDGDDVICKVVPRHRFGTEDNPIASANFTGYRWTVTDGVNSLGADTVAPTHTFTFTGWGSPITVTVAMTNRFTGAGPSLSESIA